MRTCEERIQIREGELVQKGKGPFIQSGVKRAFLSRAFRRVLNRVLTASAVKGEGFVGLESVSDSKLSVNL